jgi:phosphonoacetaldehyde hydrolase
MVKIGDTPADMREAVNAGMWAVGVTESGNEVGLTPQELDALPPADREIRTGEAARRLRAAGAHFVTAGMWSCLPVIREIEKLVRRGERPPEGTPQ